MLPMRGGAIAPRAFCAASFISLSPYDRVGAEGMPVGDMGSSFNCAGILEGGFKPEGFAEFCMAE